MVLFDSKLEDPTKMSLKSVDTALHHVAGHASKWLREKCHWSCGKMSLKAFPSILWQNFEMTANTSYNSDSGKTTIDLQIHTWEKNPEILLNGSCSPPKKRGKTPKKHVASEIIKNPKLTNSCSSHLTYPSFPFQHWPQHMDTSSEWSKKYLQVSTNASRFGGNPIEAKDPNPVTIPAPPFHYSTLPPFANIHCDLSCICNGLWLGNSFSL